jgi:hypothetical protein
MINAAVNAMLGSVITFHPTEHEQKATAAINVTAVLLCARHTDV